MGSGGSGVGSNQGVGSNLTQQLGSPSTPQQIGAQALSSSPSGTVGGPQGPMTPNYTSAQQGQLLSNYFNPSGYPSAPIYAANAAPGMNGAPASQGTGSSASPLGTTLNSNPITPAAAIANGIPAWVNTPAPAGPSQPSGGSALSAVGGGYNPNTTPAYDASSAAQAAANSNSASAYYRYNPSAYPGSGMAPNMNTQDAAARAAQASSPPGTIGGR